MAPCELVKCWTNEGSVLPQDHCSSITAAHLQLTCSSPCHVICQFCSAKSTVLLYQGSSGDNSLQSLSDDLISNELTNIHSQQDVSNGSTQASESAKGTANSARDQTASAVEYVEGQMKTKSDPKVQLAQSSLHVADEVCLLSVYNHGCRRTLRSLTSRMQQLTPLTM